MDFLKKPATFRIDQIDGTPKGDELDILWTAFATRPNQACIFKIQLVLKIPLGFPPMAFTTGKFIRVDDFPATWDGSWFLRELMRVLEVPNFPQYVEPSNELPFAAIIWGLDDYRNEDGSFTSQKPGNWLPMKITMGEDSSEVYLNLNPEEGIGEFAIKHGYGEGIVKEFAKIILPKQDS